MDVIIKHVIRPNSPEVRTVFYREGAPKGNIPWTRLVFLATRIKRKSDAISVLRKLKKSGDPYSKEAEIVRVD